VFNDRDEELSIIIDQGQIFFKTPTKNLVSRLVDGTFPDYHAIIPHKTKSEIVVSRTEFISGIKLVSALSGKGNDITIRVKEGGRGLELVAGEGGLGENEYALSGKTKGDPFSVVFNWKYLLDGLRVFKGSEVILKVNSAGPALVVSHEDPHLQYVVMPIRA
jgi:DNA polymerase-3 subunit beta